MHGQALTKGPDPWLALALTVLAAIPRFWSFDGLGLVQFDEAVYAIGSHAVYDGAFPKALLPFQHELSPPFMLLITGTVMSLLDSDSELVLIGVSAVFGTLTAGLIYIVSQGNIITNINGKVVKFERTLPMK